MALEQIQNGDSGAIAASKIFNNDKQTAAMSWTSADAGATYPTVRVFNDVLYQVREGQTANANNPAAMPLIWRGIGGSAINGFTSDSTTVAGSAKNDKTLHDSIKELRFGVSSQTVYNPLTPTAVNDLGTVSAYASSGGNVSFDKSTTDYGSKIILFAENEIRYTVVSSVGWMVYGKNTAGNFMAISFTPGATTITFVVFTAGGGYTDLNLAAFTADIAIDTTKSHYIKYLSTTIEIYQDDALLMIIPAGYVGGKNFDVKAFGFVVDSAITSVSYKYTTNVASTIASPNITTDKILMLNATKGDRIIFDADLPKILPRKFKGKKITGLGDSIMVGYDSANFQTMLLAKTGAALLTRRGISGQSFSGQLQSNAVIDTVIADNPDVVILHSVNDPRSGAPLGSVADTIGAATLIGGLKKICNSLITFNKDIKIFLCTPLTYGGVAGGWENVRSDMPVNGLYLSQYRQAMLDFGAMYSVDIVDLTLKCGFRPQVESTANRIFTSDGVHPVAIGYDVMTDIIAEHINYY